MTMKKGHIYYISQSIDHKSDFVITWVISEDESLFD